MPTSYSHTISDGQSAFIFVKLLVRWKGSLYKLLWIDLLIYVSLFYGLHFLYRGLDNEHKKNFEEIVKYCDAMKTNIPLSFLLGFFVAGVLDRWWKMYMAIPWLNRMAFLSDGSIVGQTSERVRKMKMTLMRYLILSWILLMREISKQIHIRFSKKNVNSTEEYSVREILVNFNQDRKIQSTFRKIITDAEIQAFEHIAAQNFARTNTKYVPEYWIPLQWASRLLQKGLLNGYIVDMRTTVKLIEELDNLRHQMHHLKMLCSIMIPLVYTQVVIIAVYSYFLCQLFASQLPIKEHCHTQNATRKDAVIGHNVDFFFYPLFTVFQFLFIMGWLKVAICLLNPFGDAQEDFKTTEILDMNLDICWRCGSTELCTFPEMLTPVNFKFRGGDNQYTDSFHCFIEATEDDLEEIDPPLVEHDLTALELSPTACMKIKKSLCSQCFEADDLLPTIDNFEETLVSKSKSSLVLDDSWNEEHFKSRRSIPILNEPTSSNSNGDSLLGSNAHLVPRTYSRQNIIDR